jgi:outer membrane protein assembly factor BamD
MAMNGRVFLGVLLAATLALLGCGSSDQTVTLTPEQRFEAAKERFDKEDYLEAANQFTVITLQYQGSKVAADAQFYLAECRFMRGDYILAAFEYGVVKRNYPASPRVADAQFKLALCYYYRVPRPQLDQEYTRKAIDEFQSFVEYYPTHKSVPEAEEKIRELTRQLALRQFSSAELYATMGYTKAALFYYDSVIEKYHDTEFAPKAYLRKAEVLRDKGRVPEAIAELSKLIARYPHSEELPDASKLRDRLEEKGR